MARLRRGFTVIELLACLGTVGVVGAIGAIRVGSPGSYQPPTPREIDLGEIQRKLDELLARFEKFDARLGTIEKQIADDRAAAREALRNAKNTSAQLKDANQLRGIMQAFIVWSQNHREHFPLPSLIDMDDSTVKGEAESKDITANIFSLLIFNGFVPPEMSVSVAEVNPTIKVNEMYEFNEPKAAAAPQKALWDPAFSADFTDGKAGNVSYGHWLPFAERRAMWSSTFLSAQAVVGNRGPQIAGVTGAGGAAIEQLVNPASNTLRIHGELDKWEGNTAYGDGHTDFHTTLSPRSEAHDFRDGQGKKRADCLFFDEPDDPQHRNNYLGIFTAAGKKASDWKSIWD